jgi:hypothetical protein
MVTNAGMINSHKLRTGDLSIAASLCESGVVKPNLAIRRLLAILMIAGLALAPVSRPVMAATSSQSPHEMRADAMTPSEMAADTMDEMASEMPCCPSKAPAPVDCDKCVFMVACGSLCFAGVSATVSHPFPILSDTIALHRNDAWPDGLGHPPPEHPPRSLV